MKDYKINFEDTNINFNIGLMAKQADGSIFVNYGKTDFLVTVVKKEQKEDRGFFPLVINYEEKMYSLGKIPANYLRREAKPTDNATLNARVIDRCLRPLFPEGFNQEVQVVISILGYDKDYSPEMVAISAASLAINIAGLPIDDLVSGISVVKHNDKLIVNPSLEERLEASFELKAAGTNDALNMIEFKGEETSEEEVLEVLDFAHSKIKKLNEFQKKVLEDLEINKVEFVKKEAYQEELFLEINKKYEEEVSNVLKNNQVKKVRNEKLNELKEKIFIEFKNEENKEEVEAIFDKIYKDIFIKLIVEDKYRLDGRKPNEVRKLSSQVDVLQKAHGSALFTRGETQALAVTTLGVKSDAQILDGLEDVDGQRFILHYNFPPYSVGETGRMGAPGRREIGHGNLAYKALEKMIPTYEEFPYTIRLVSEILESNGSSSQATICAATMSLMASGVPLKKPVAGIAMGLIKKENDFTILTDIAGLEDHLGDMDFKVAGTSDGITAIQMDIKIKGISKEIFKECLSDAKDGREVLLDHMNKTIAVPRENVNDSAPQVKIIKILKEQIKDVIGKGGETINKIIEETNVKIDIDEDGEVSIYGENLEMIEKASKIIEKITKVYEKGQQYDAKVVRIEKFGAFVNFDGVDALLHISDLDEKRVEKVEDKVALDDIIRVEIKEVDSKKRIKVKLINKE